MTTLDTIKFFLYFNLTTYANFFNKCPKIKVPMNENDTVKSLTNLDVTAANTL